MRNRKIDIVLGLGYGDEGKGNTVNALANEHSIVVRFNGGHQAGHTVVHKGKKHVFSSFGSGTLKGTATYISRFCTINPISFMREYNTFVEKPVVYFDRNVMLTTPIDIIYNRLQEKQNKHGSIGVGFGATIERNENNFPLVVNDALYPEILKTKVRLINEYYLKTANAPLINDREIHNWLLATQEMLDKIVIVNDFNEIALTNHIIFEGAQGIMLDKDIGFFPFVTRSNTTSKNVFTLLDEWNLDYDMTNITTYYVTRAYATRHGNGPLFHEDKDTNFITRNPDETNVTNQHQGEFRYAILDYDVLDYAVQHDREYNRSNHDVLIITCLDHVNKDKDITFIKDDGIISSITPQKMAADLNILLGKGCRTPEFKF